MFKSGSSALRKRRLYVVSFAAGFGTALVCVAFIMHVILGGRLISQHKLDRYVAVDDEFGQYYDMERLISSKSYYKRNSEGTGKLIAGGIIKTVDDKYAEYMTGKEYDAFERRYLSSYSGVGVALKMDENNRIVVSRVLAGSDAERSGITSGDILLKIDSKNVKSLEDAGNLMNDAAGSEIEFTISRSGVVKEYKLNRSKVEDDGITYDVKDSAAHIGYVRISTFRKGTAKAFRSAVSDLKAKGCDKVVIDLRGNTGGVVEEAFDTADEVLGKAKLGRIISKSKTKTYSSDSKSQSVNVVVLVDGDTASAAEIFAAAVKANEVKIVGSRTYGKGVIQTVFKLKGGAVVKLTTAEYVDPDGKKINNKGIEPDIKADSGEQAEGEAIRILTGKQ